VTPYTLMFRALWKIAAASFNLEIQWSVQQGCPQTVRAGHSVCLS
jgi:hypothetical protein